MQHADYYVLTGTAFPILLLAMFASDTPILGSEPLGGFWSRLYAAGTLCTPIFGLAMCAYALTFDSDWKHLRTAIFTLLMLASGRLALVGIDQHHRTLAAAQIEDARQEIQIMVDASLGPGVVKVHAPRTGSFILASNQKVPEDLVRTASRVASKIAGRGASARTMS